MALDPEMLDDYIRRRGRFMVHATRADAVGAVLDEGLRPGSELGFSSKGGFFETREAHVYLCEPSKLPVVEVAGSRAYVRVDLRKLDSARFDPDEDQVQQSFDVRGGGWVAQARPSPHEPDEADRRAVGRALAEWADTTEGFDAPDVTARSLDSGWVSYRGTIPPDAIEVVTIPSEAALLFHTGANLALNNPSLDVAPAPPLGFYKTEVARAGALARSVIASAAESVGEPADQLLPDWPHPEHALTTRDRLIKARRDRSRAGEQRQAEVLSAARQVAESASDLQPELGWSRARDACINVAQAAVAVVRCLREHVGEEPAVTAARAAMDAVAAVSDQN